MLKTKIISLYLTYLRLAAKIQLWKIKPKIIAVTGSAGKSSATNAIFAILKDFYSCKESRETNSETGLPLNILGLKLDGYNLSDWIKASLLVPIKLITNWQKYDYYIAELAVDSPDEPKNMSYLLRFIKPGVAVFLNVFPVHTMQFENGWRRRHPGRKFTKKKLVDLLALEKGLLITTLGRDKTAIVNRDDKRVWQIAANLAPPVILSPASCGAKNPPGVATKVLCFGRHAESDLRILDYQLKDQGSLFAFQYQDSKATLILKYCLPQYYASTFAAAILTAIAAGIDFSQAVLSLQKNFRLPPARSSIIAGIKGTTLIDSSYNSSKIPLLGMLDLLGSWPTKKEKIAVLGDMRELGDQAKSEHEEIAAKAVAVADRLVLIGPLMKKYALPIIKHKFRTFVILRNKVTKDPLRFLDSVGDSSFPSTPFRIGKQSFDSVHDQNNTRREIRVKKTCSVYWFANVWQAGDFLLKKLAGGEVVLIKGSQNEIFLEIVTKALMKDKDQAKKLLCRQTPFWEQRRILLCGCPKDNAATSGKQKVNPS